MKLRVLPGKLLHEQIGSRMCHLKGGEVFDHPNEERAKKLLALDPPQVERAPLAAVTPKVKKDETEQKPEKPSKSSKEK